MNIIVLTLALFLSAFSYMQGQFKGDALIRQTFSIGSLTRADISTFGGAIKVEGANDEIVVEVFARKRGRWITDLDDRALVGTEIRVESMGEVLLATAKRKNKWMKGSSGLSIAFRIKVPKGMDLGVQTSGGSIDLSHLDAKIKASTSGGSVNMSDVRGEADVKTSGGRIDIESFVGRLEARTSGGSIDLEDADGRLYVSTSGGRIDLDEVAGEIVAKTSGGRISAEVNRIDERLILKTSGGSVSATVPKDVGYDIKIVGNKVDADLVNFSGTRKKNRVEGRLNGGGAYIEMVSSGGRSKLRLK